MGGGIPIIRSLKEGLVAERIDALFGILNGTSNYILSTMSNEGGEFDAVLRDAQAKGYAEMDPRFDVEEIDAARALVRLEENRVLTRGGELPTKVLVGAMVEVPSILMELDALMMRADFVSVGSNDLLQFMFAADRANPLVASRYDPLSVSALRALRRIRLAADKHGVPITLCGEMAADPLEAMALIGLGFRSISMAPAAIGPVKSMLLSLDCERLRQFIEARMEPLCTGNVRDDLRRFAELNSIEI